MVVKKGKGVIFWDLGFYMVKFGVGGGFGMSLIFFGFY